MKSSVVKRSVLIGNHKTSVSLEQPFWDSMKEISRGVPRRYPSWSVRSTTGRSRAIYLRQYVCLCSNTLEPLPEVARLSRLMPKRSASLSLQHPIHRRALAVLHLDPTLRPSSLIGPVLSLRYRSLQSHPAGSPKNQARFRVLRTARQRFPSELSIQTRRLVRSARARSLRKAKAIQKWPP